MGVDHPVGPDPPADDAGSPVPAPGLASPVCALCGLPLTEQSPPGKCPRCALRLALGADEEEDLPPDAPKLRYGHFEVAQDFDGLPVQLGSGAMATTYRALDTVLRLPVALKVISDRVAGNPDARARFLREARAAGRLHHPNVASVTFYGEQDGECFYAMELVEGETLAERMHRLGPFSPEETMEIGVQVARALAAAEACGVVHRDLKPGNLMLLGASAPDSPATGLHVKVIDWGLAKAVSATDEFLGADQTRDAFVGTPAFASPEQFARTAGERRIDTRSDIYSLGVTLWYLVCGKTPFVGDTLDAIHARQRKPPLEQLAAAKVPACLSDVLRRMVAFDPAARPQSARELLDVLRRCQQKYTDEPPAGAWRQRSRRLAAGALVLLVLGIGWGGWRWRHAGRVPATSRAEKFALAVLPFENLDADQTKEFFVTAVRDEIANNLAHVAAFDVIGAESTRDYPAGRSRDLPGIGRELGVRYLLEGSVRRQDGQVQVSVRLSDLRDPDHPWSEQYRKPLSEVFAVQGEITRAVVTHLRAALTDQEEAVIDRPPTGDPAAYDLYLRGKDDGLTDQASEQDYRSRLATNVSLLEQAVKLDSKFALAYARLVNDYIQISVSEAGSGRGEAAAAHRNQAEDALARAVRLQPDAGETHLAQAHLFYELHANYEQALQELALARRALSSNAELENLASFVARDQGHWDEAIRFLERVVLLEPRSAERRYSLALAYRLQRRFADSDREMTRVVTALPRDKSLVFRMVLATGRLEERADLAPLRAVIDGVTPEDAAAPELMTRFRLIVALYSHDVPGAAGLLAAIPAEGLEWGVFPLPKPWFEALAARLRHDDAAARDAFTRARVEEDRLFAANPLSSYGLSILAMIDAGLGDKDKAASEARHALDLNLRDPFSGEAPMVAYQVAVAYAWMDQPDLACQTLEPWTGRPAAWSLVKVPNYGDFRLNPVWDPLQGNPRFAALVARFAPEPGKTATVAANGQP